MGGIGRALKPLVSRSIVVFALLLSPYSNASDGPNLTWSQLNAEQQSVLQPLAHEWDSLRPWQRARMLSIARDYPKMSADKQVRLQERLSQWSRMTPYEREQARKRHQQFKALSPEKQAEIKKQWQAYEKLSDAEKNKLYQGARPDDAIAEE